LAPAAANAIKKMDELVIPCWDFARKKVDLDKMFTAYPDNNTLKGAVAKLWPNSRFKDENSTWYSKPSDIIGFLRKIFAPDSILVDQNLHIPPASAYIVTLIYYERLLEKFKKESVQHSPIDLFVHFLCVLSLAFKYTVDEGCYWIPKFFASLGYPGLHINQEAETWALLDYRLEVSEEEFKSKIYELN
jgi:hypothetical protein